MQSYTYLSDLVFFEFQSPLSRRYDATCSVLSARGFGDGFLFPPEVYLWSSVEARHRAAELVEQLALHVRSYTF